MYPITHESSSLKVCVLHHEVGSSFCQGTWTVACRDRSGGCCTNLITSLIRTSLVVVYLLVLLRMKFDLIWSRILADTFDGFTAHEWILYTSEKVEDRLESGTVYVYFLTPSVALWLTEIRQEQTWVKTHCYHHIKGLIKEVVLLSSFVPKKTMLAAFWNFCEEQWNFELNANIIMPTCSQFKHGV